MFYLTLYYDARKHKIKIIKTSIFGSLFIIHIMSVLIHGNYETYIKNGMAGVWASGVGAWIGLAWLRIETNGGTLSNAIMNPRVP